MNKDNVRQTIKNKINEQALLHIITPFSVYMAKNNDSIIYVQIKSIYLQT